MLKPHVAAAVQTSAVVAQVIGRCETLEQALSVSAEAVVLIDPNGRVVHATPAARLVIEACFGRDGLASNRLPDELDSWVAAHSVHGSRSVPPQPPVLQVTRGGRTIEAMLVRQNRSYIVVVSERLDDVPTSHRSSLSPPFTLTPREREVLEWVEQGMGNADIAQLCGISIRTFHKHLERTFEKLNVENRTAAVRKMRDQA